MPNIRTLGAGALRLVLPFIVVGAAWETVAQLGVFPAKLFPKLEIVAATFWNLATSGVLWQHAEGTLIRLTLGFVLAGTAGVALGILMGRYQ